MFADLKVLLVEDNATIRLIVTRLLSASFGIEVDIAENGRLGLEKLRQGSYDLVLMDCMMPEMDGYEATRRIRLGESGDEAKDLVVLAMTAHSTDEDREKCIQSGMTDYLSKPLRPEILGEMLERWFTR